MEAKHTEVIADAVVLKRTELATKTDVNWLKWGDWHQYCANNLQFDGRNCVAGKSVGKLIFSPRIYNNSAVAGNCSNSL